MNIYELVLAYSTNQTKASKEKHNFFISNYFIDPVFMYNNNPFHYIF